MQEPHKSNIVLILVALIGIVGAISAAAVSVIGNYSVEKLRQEGELTRIAVAANASVQVSSPQTRTETETPAQTQVELPTQTRVPAVRIGFDFSGRTPERPAGDDGAPGYLFIHYYPMPGNGSISAVTYLNDIEKDGFSEIAEPITVLVLRPEAQGWRVVYRITIPDDESPPTLAGISTFTLDFPLPVQYGDLFAHWQGDASAGPLPMNTENASIDMLSAGRFDLVATDLEVGKTIYGAFVGRRDYFINVLFEPAP